MAIPTDWQIRAACRGSDPDIFFPAPGDLASAAGAKAVCASCDVRTACLAYALATGSTDGIWGGLDEKERRLGLRVPTDPAAAAGRGSAAGGRRAVGSSHPRARSRRTTAERAGLDVAEMRAVVGKLRQRLRVMEWPYAEGEVTGRTAQETKSVPSISERSAELG